MARKNVEEIKPQVVLRRLDLKPRVALVEPTSATLAGTTVAYSAGTITYSQVGQIYGGVVGGGGFKPRL